MRIIRDRVKCTLRLSQAEYVKRVLIRFNMNKTKLVGASMGGL